MVPASTRARIETVPPSHQAKATDRETRKLTATADTYEAATAQVRALVPGGWRMLFVDVER